MSEFGVATGPTELRIERLLPGPIERVWEYLTDPVKRGTWLATGPMELVAGGRVELKFRHSDLSPVKETPPERFMALEGSTEHGRITACEPPYLLSFDWDEGPGNDPSEVTFALSAQGDDVLLTLTHRRLGSRDLMVMVASGWHTHLDILVDHASGRVPKPYWSAFMPNMAAYEQRLGAGTLNTVADKAPDTPV